MPLYQLPQPVLAADSIAVPTNSPEQARRRQVLADWANVGLSADLMRPQGEERFGSAVENENQAWEQQSYCCR